MGESISCSRLSENGRGGEIRTCQTHVRQPKPGKLSGLDAEGKLAAGGFLVGRACSFVGNSGKLEFTCCDGLKVYSRLASVESSRVARFVADPVITPAGSIPWASFSTWWLFGNADRVACAVAQEQEGGHVEFWRSEAQNALS